MEKILIYIFIGVIALIGIALSILGVVFVKKSSKSHSTGMMIAGVIMLFYGFSFIVGTVIGLVEWGLGIS